MSAVPGLSLRDTIAEIIEDAIDYSSRDGRPLRRMRVRDVLTEMVIADDRLVLALRTNTREGYFTALIDGTWVCGPRQHNYAMPSVLVVLVDPPEANDA